MRSSSAGKRSRNVTQGSAGIRGTLDAGAVNTTSVQASPESDLKGRNTSNCATIELRRPV
jgi:hypothetical protein